MTQPDIGFASDRWRIDIHRERRARYRLVAHRTDPDVEWIGSVIGHAMTLRSARRQARRWLNREADAQQPPVEVVQ